MTSQEEIEALIKEALGCCIDFRDKGEPKVVPVCFGYEHCRISNHSHPEGKKMDMIRENARVVSGLMPELNFSLLLSPCVRRMR